jgi:hypothetical protein
MRFAKVTSFDQTSNFTRFVPTMPHKIFPGITQKQHVQRDAEMERETLTSVDADTHFDSFVTLSIENSHRLNHSQTHFHATYRVIVLTFRIHR